MQANTFNLTLKEAYLISPRVKHFIFNTTTTDKISYLPGQFLTIHFTHQGKVLRRSYSIANAPKDDTSIEFAAAWVEHGPGSDLLFHLEPGETLQASGPFGRLVLNDPPPKRYVLVATSTGVTPYRAMLNQLQQQLIQYPTLELVILQGVRSVMDLLYHDEFIAFANHNSGVIYRAQLSETTQTSHDNYCHSGYVQHAFPTLNLNPEQDRVYLCGNPNMVDDAFTWLKAHDFPLQHIVREKYLSR